jgi:hypothetical protein
MAPEPFHDHRELVSSVETFDAETAHDFRELGASGREDSRDFLRVIVLQRLHDFDVEARITQEWTTQDHGIRHQAMTPGHPPAQRPEQAHRPCTDLALVSRQGPARELPPGDGHHPRLNRHPAARSRVSALRGWESPLWAPGHNGSSVQDRIRRHCVRRRWPLGHPHAVA